MSCFCPPLVRHHPEVLQYIITYHVLVYVICNCVDCHSTCTSTRAIAHVKPASSRAGQVLVVLHKSSFVVSNLRGKGDRKMVSKFKVAVAFSYVICSVVLVLLLCVEDVQNIRSYLPSPLRAGWECFECPKDHDNKYSEECLDNAIPPWPICLFHDVDYFVDKSMDGATRCCGDDTSACRCPKKDTPSFLERIDEWCEGIATCSKNDNV